MQSVILHFLKFTLFAQLTARLEGDVSWSQPGDEEPPMLTNKAQRAD
jgi:hypothetical protein